MSDLPEKSEFLRLPHLRRFDVLYEHAAVMASAVDALAAEVQALREQLRSIADQRRDSP